MHTFPCVMVIYGFVLVPFSKLSGVLLNIMHLYIQYIKSININLNTFLQLCASCLISLHQQRALVCQPGELAIDFQFKRLNETSLNSGQLITVREFWIVHVKCVLVLDYQLICFFAAEYNATRPHQSIKASLRNAAYRPYWTYGISLLWFSVMEQ